MLPAIVTLTPAETEELPSVETALDRLRAYRDEIVARHIVLGDPETAALIRSEKFMSVWRTMMDLLGAADDLINAIDRAKP